MTTTRFIAAILLTIAGSTATARAAAEPVVASRVSVHGLLTGAVGTQETYTGSFTITTPATWTNLHHTPAPPSGRFSVKLSDDCTMTVSLGARSYARKQSAKAVTIANLGEHPVLGLGVRAGGVWGVTFRGPAFGPPIDAVATVEIRRHRYLQVTVGGGPTNGSTCTYAQILTVARDVRTMVRTADLSRIKINDHQ